MKKFFPIITVSLLFIASMFILYNSQEDRLIDTNNNRICLNKNLNRKKLEDILIKNAYVSTKEDARVISEYLESLLKGGKKLSNLGSLNSREFQIPARIIENKGGEGLKKRLSLSYADLGCENISMKDSTNMIVPDSACTISVIVKDDGKHFFNEGVVESVEVCLIQHLDSVNPESNRAEDKPLIIAKRITDQEGMVTFKVDPRGFYSVIPIRKGFEYGVPKGTTNGIPIGEEDVRDYTFKQKEHCLRLFDRATYDRIKADGVICVRSDGDYVTELVMITVVFLLVWWLTFFIVRWRDIVMTRRDSTRYRDCDIGLVSILMLLNGICLFSMLAITNPLVDTDYAQEMILGTVIGCLGFCIFSSVDYVKYYSGLYVIKFDMVSSWMKRHWSEKVPEGIGFLFVAFLFIFLLGLFGSGPEGSDAKVNLFFFQPSEISKFLVITTIAIFFTANAHMIQAFSNGHFVAQAKTLVWIIIAIVFLLILYVGVISDMGPALVLSITFIILYSILRQDLLQMSVGVFTYLVILSFVSQIPVEDKVSIVLWLSILWFFVWFVGGYLWKKRIYESAVFMNILILLFTQGGELLKMLGRPYEGERLMKRIAVSGDGIWDNTVRGGDQVAQGIWALASGGFTGQGLGNGNANLIPAFQTDMIFESIGEVMGFIALFAVILCYAMLIWKCLKRSIDSGHQFLLFMIAGISIVTTVQLFVIVMGSLGIIPLTGVSLPFLSYGKAGLVVNLVFFGIVLGMSRYNPSEEERHSVSVYRNVFKSGRVVSLFLFVIVLAFAFNYQVLSRDTYLTKPAKITNLAGARILEQNPRINILLRNLDAGDIFDRDGRLLATSSVETLKLYKDSLTKAGISENKIDSLTHTLKRRYYPFEEHMFFMLGDMNTRNLSSSVFSKNPYGYLAEERHLDYLRNLTFLKDTIVLERNYKLSPYSRNDIRKDTIFIPVYGSCPKIVEMLKDGVNGSIVKQWNKDIRKNSIYLTTDANLQVSLQKEMEAKADLLKDKFSRVSLVILDANNGDLLCSANYPTPDQDLIAELFYKRRYDYTHLDSTYGKYTERDLGLTYQSRPGSTAKIISALAGLKGIDSAQDVRAISFPIKLQDRILRNGGATPETAHEPWTNVKMENAIKYSSNCYFINLINKYDLYDELDDLYQKLGVRFGYHGLWYDTYMFHPQELSKEKSRKFSSIMATAGENGKRRYMDYLKWDDNKRDGVEKNRGMSQIKVKFIYGMGTEEGDLEASPLNMARVASIAANGGVLVGTRYVLPAAKAESADTIRIISEERSSILRSFMSQESAININDQFSRLGGGKTGTPSRGVEISKRNFLKDDGWYICYIEKSPSDEASFNGKDAKKNKRYIAVALRVEQCDKKQGSPSGSGMARKYMKEVVLPTLNRVGYINYNNKQ